jgi:hypothetical protein
VTRRDGPAQLAILRPFAGRPDGSAHCGAILFFFCFLPTLFLVLEISENIVNLKGSNLQIRKNTKLEKQTNLEFQKRLPNKNNF